MDFAVPDPVQRMVRVVRDFLREEVYPLEGQFLASSFRQMLPLLE